MKVDVVLLTKDSNKPYFKQCLESLYLNFPVNRLIVIDGGSTDGTIEVLRNYEGIEFYYDVEGTRGSSRQIGISKVSTEWFFFLDSDVIIHDGWFKKAKEFMTNKTGAIQGWEHPVGLPSEISDFGYAMDKLNEIIKRQRKTMFTDSRIRGFTGCVLIRTKAVNGIKIPPSLHDYEDWYIKKHIEKKGYKWLTTR